MPTTYQYPTTFRQRGPNQFGGTYYGGNYPSGQLSDDDRTRGSLLYDPDDPNQAFDSALRDYGINPYAQNPFTQNLRRQAAPLSTAYNASMALFGTPQSNYGNPAGAGGNVTNPTELATYPFQYAMYMQNALQGAGTPNMQRTQFNNEAPVYGTSYAPSGGVYTNIANARQQLPYLIHAMRQEDMNQSGNVASANPFLGALKDQFDEGSDTSQAGMGVVNYLSQLSSPLMSTGLRDAYRRQLIQRQQNALRQFMAPGGAPPGADIYTYLLGLGTTPPPG